MARYGTDPAGNPLDRFGLSRPVWLLGWVSFFTDTASEMVYPLLPLFLTRVLGASAMSLAVIAGVPATAFLYFYPEAYRRLFMWTLVPGLIVIALILRLPDQKLTPVSSAVSASSVAPRASRLPPRFYRAVAVITLFSLGNASDAFVLLRLNDVGVSA